jgi:flagellar motor switch protein FliN/FliY
MADTKSEAAPLADSLDATITGLNPKLIDSVDVTLEAFLGESRMTVAELLALRPGSIVELDASLGQAVELRLNGVAVARGELVAAGDKFAVRLTEISK